MKRSTPAPCIEFEALASGRSPATTLISAYSAVTKGPPDEVRVGDNYINLRWNNMGPLKFKPVQQAPKGARNPRAKSRATRRKR